MSTSGCCRSPSTREPPCVARPRGSAGRSQRELAGTSWRWIRKRCASTRAGNRSRAGARYRRCPRHHPLTRLPSIKAMSRAHTGTLTPPLLSSLRPRVTNARTEETNRITKQLKRVGCGYRNQDNYERRIVLHVAAKSAA
ncbi:MAG: transposase [Mycobacterium leprae]